MGLPLPGWDSLRDRWETIRTSLWFVPTTMALMAMVAATLLPEIDRSLPDEVTQRRDWMFTGSPSAARTMLSVISGSLITVISLLFSITMLTLQQASTQFTPRVVGAFTRDRGNQLVLGTYIATFVYALLVLRQVRDETDARPEFVPLLAMTVAVALALICLALLVYFIHHSATLLQVSSVITRVQDELHEQVERLYPAPIGQPITAASDAMDDDPTIDADANWPATPGRAIHSTRHGFLRVIDDSVLARELPPGGWAVIPVQIGDYLLTHQVLLTAGPAQEIDDERAARLERACIIGDQRTMTQDVMFGIRQLADVALKALSPGINDPTTAEHAISALGDAIAQLAPRDFPDRDRILNVDANSNGNGDATNGDTPNHVRIRASRPSFDDIVNEAFGQIIAITTDAHVLRHLARVLTTLLNQTNTPTPRPATLQRHLDAVIARQRDVAES